MDQEKSPAGQNLFYINQEFWKSENVSEKIQIKIGLILWLWFILDVTLQDVDGFIFVCWDVYYYGWITNKRVMIAVIRKDFSKNKARQAVMVKYMVYGTLGLVTKYQNYAFSRSYESFYI